MPATTLAKPQAGSGLVSLFRSRVGRFSGENFPLRIARSRLSRDIEIQHKKLKNRNTIIKPVAMKILVVEDEPKLAAVLSKGLKAESYIVDVVDNGQSAVESAFVNEYDIIILDYLLPQKNGLQVLQEVKKNGCPSKVLMLTAKDSIQDKVDGLNRGADDYMVKPFAFEELLARIRMLLRRGNANEKESTLTADDLVLDLVKHEVKRGNQLINLSAKEYALLEFFLRHPNELISRTQLWEHVWDMEVDNFSNVVDVYVCYLRNKIDKSPYHPLIFTMRGKGYMLKTDV